MQVGSREICNECAGEEEEEDQVREVACARGLISRWWFAGLNIPSHGRIIYREPWWIERGKRKRENGVNKIETCIYVCTNICALVEAKTGREGIRKRERKKKSYVYRRREGGKREKKKDREGEEEREEVELCYYRAPP